jgi:hypothetical protein
MFDVLADWERDELDAQALSEERQAEWYETPIPAPERRYTPEHPPVEVAVRLEARRPDGTWPRRRLTTDELVDARRELGDGRVLTSWDQFDPTDYHLYPNGLVLLDPPGAR